MNGVPLTETVGWLATAVFVASYFTAHAGTLRRVQVAGALIWMTYGALIGALPVIVSNVLVCAAATCSILRHRRSVRTRPLGDA
jgi:hypothetical protein